MTQSRCAKCGCVVMVGLTIYISTHHDEACPHGSLCQALRPELPHGNHDEPRGPAPATSITNWTITASANSVIGSTWTRRIK